MKKLFTIIFHTILLTALSGSSYAQLAINDVAFWPTMDTLHAAVSLDTGTVLVAGTNRIILKSTDSGNTWQKFFTGPEESGFPDQLFAPDPVNLFMGYDLNGNIDPGYAWYSSNDAGETWNAIEFPAGLTVSDIHFFDAVRWFAVGADSLMMRTSDGGLTWDILQHSAGSGYPIREIFFLDDVHGWYTTGVSRQRFVFSTTNGGVSWQQISYGFYYDPQFIDPLTGFSRGLDHIYKTTDGEVTWFSIFLEQSPKFDYWIIDSGHLYISYGYPYNPSGPAPTVKYSSDGGNTWEATNYTSNNFTIYDIVEVNGKVMIVGAWGYIAVSVEPLVFKSLTGDMMTGIFAFEDKAIVVGYGGELYWIKDNGLTWEKINVEFNGGPNQITFINDSIGFIIGSTFLRTKDGGNTWQNINFNLPYIYSTPFRADRNENIYVNTGPLFRSSDFGETWTEISFPFNTPFFYVYDSLHLWASTNIFTDGNFHRTTNGGFTWDTIGVNVVVGCEFFSPDSGYGFYSSGSQLALSVTYDGGLSWNPKIQSYIQPGYVSQTEHHPDYSYLLTKGFYVGSDESIYPFQFSEWKDESYDILLSFTAKERAAFSFYDRTNGWIAAGRRVFRVQNNWVTGSGDAAENLPLKYELSNNYPNPFNPSTIISFKIPEKTFVSLKIYDVLGNLISEPVNEEKLPGTYQAELNGASLSSGVYFYTLKAGSFTQTRKMILMK